MCASASPADDRSNQIDTATFAAQCDSFKIVVAGHGVDKPNPIVGYNIHLKPSSGTTLIITDSFPVQPDEKGVFRTTFTNSWKTFGFTLEGKYTLSGSAVLVSGLTPFSTVTLTSSRATLTCRKE
jgi:hypothetical protein